MSSALIIIICFIIFFTLALVGIPVAFALLLSSVVGLYLSDISVMVVSHRLFKGINSFPLLAVPFFLLAGRLMTTAGVAQDMVNFSESLVGRLRGALAHINVLVSMFFAGISGSSTADTAGIGSIMIPAMLKKGYPKDYTVAVTAASSTLGVVIPPSLLMVIYGCMGGVSVGALLLGGIIPGILIGFSLMTLNSIFARTHQFPFGEDWSIRKILTNFKKAILPLGVPIIIVGGIMGGIFTPTEAGVIAVVYALIIIALYRSMNLVEIVKEFSASVTFYARVMFCVATASIFAWLLTIHHVPDLAGELIRALTTNKFMVYMLIIGAYLVIGLFMDAVPAIIIMLPIVQPLAESVGINQIHLGVGSVAALAIGLITPPYGLCLLLASDLADIPIADTLKTTFLFTLVMISILFVIGALPDTVMLIPKLTMPYVK